MELASTTVPLVTLTGDRAGDAEVVPRAEGGRCILRLRKGTLEIVAEGSDFFEALCGVRSQLETKGFLVASYGGSRTVFPSGMARDMGAGLRAYRLTLGNRSRSQDLVGIFETGPDVEPSTVNQQQAFFRQWLTSIGASPKSGSG